MQVGYAVIYNNETIGYVTCRDATRNLINQINSDVKLYSENISAEQIDPSFNPSFMPVFKFSTEDEIASKIKDSLGFYVDGCTFEIDGEEKFIVKNEEEANEALHKFQLMNIGEGEVLSVTLGNTVTYKNERVPYAKIISVEDAVKTLAGTNSTDDLYTVKEGDTIWGICMAQDIMVDYVIEVNGLETDTIVPGQKLRLTPPSPLIDVVVQKKISYIEYRPYETEYQYDKTYEKNKKQTLQEGKQGETQVEAIITLHNMHETEREELSRNLLCEPTTEVIRVGTKPKPSNAPTGTFMRPVGGYVSSPFGNRSRGYHTGIDYACPVGTPVKAADGGTVTSSGWGGGYGYMIKISHGNGYETLYAHNSRLAVKAGAKVAKGQVIAYVGSTGNSTGPHLHFEIRKNGAYLNPAKYV